MKYSYSPNEENYYGCFDSPEEAAWEGMAEVFADSEEGDALFIYVGENHDPDLSCPIDANDAIDKLIDCNEDFQIEVAENFAPSKKEKEDLTRRLKDAWSSWIEFNHISADFFIVKNVKEYEFVFHNEEGNEEKDLAERGVLKLVEKKK